MGTVNRSARLLLLALTFLGAWIPVSPAAAGPFSYDRALPLQVRILNTQEHEHTVVQTISFAITRSTRVAAYLVTPRTPGRHPAILFAPGRRQTRAYFLQEARREASRGAVALSMGDLSRGYPTFTLADLSKLAFRVVALRRALDLLAARPDVYPRRIGFVGHSDGAELGGMLAGIDHRVAAYVLMSGGGMWDRSSDPAYNSAVAPYDAYNFIGKARPAPLFLQSGWRDAIVPRENMLRFQQFASAPKLIRWYQAPHRLNERARADRDAWLERRLGL